MFGGKRVVLLRIHVHETVAKEACDGSTSASATPPTVSVVVQWSMPALHDLILDAVLHKNHVVVVTAHNHVEWWCIAQQSLVYRTRCSQNCILYSATLWGTSYDSLYVVAGTVFCEILIWKAAVPPARHVRASPASGAVAGLSDNRETDIVCKFTSHQGAIFSCRLSTDGRQLISTSDDRSIRVWTVPDAVVSLLLGNPPEKAVPVPGSTMMRPGATQGTTAASSTASDRYAVVTKADCIVYAHASRVWDARLLPQTIVSIGEDAVCCISDRRDGCVLHRHVGHSGQNIWSMGIAALSQSRPPPDQTPDVRHIVVTGGGDGAVRVWMADRLRNNDSLQRMQTAWAAGIEFPAPISSSTAREVTDFPRLLSAASSTACFVCTHQGTLYLQTFPIQGGGLARGEEDSAPAKERGQQLVLLTIPSKQPPHAKGAGKVQNDRCFFTVMDAVVDGDLCALGAVDGTVSLVSAAHAGRCVRWQANSTANPVLQVFWHRRSEHSTVTSTRTTLHAPVAATTASLLLFTCDNRNIRMWSVASMGATVCVHLQGVFAFASRVQVQSLCWSHSAQYLWVGDREGTLFGFHAPCHASALGASPAVGGGGVHLSWELPHVEFTNATGAPQHETNPATPGHTPATAHSVWAVPPAVNADFEQRRVHGNKKTVTCIHTVEDTVPHRVYTAGRDGYYREHTCTLSSPHGAAASVLVCDPAVRSSGDMQECDTMECDTGEDECHGSRGPTAVNTVAKHRVSSKMDWITRIAHAPQGQGAPVVAGFESGCFVAVHAAGGHELCRVNCGGGHRSWDYVLDQKASTGELPCTFFHIRDRQVHAYMVERPHRESVGKNRPTPVVQASFHGREVTCAQQVASVSDPSQHFLLTGGEDCALRVSSLRLSPTDGRGLDYDNIPIQGHASSIRCMCVVPVEDTWQDLLPHSNEVVAMHLLFTGGGNGLVKCWLVQERNASAVRHNGVAVDLVAEWPPHRGTRDFRVMDVHHLATSVNRTGDSVTVHVVAACSDATFRLFALETRHRRLRLLDANTTRTKCILCLATATVCGRLLVFSGSTDGCVHVWDYTHAAASERIQDLVPVATFTNHQSGINAIAVAQPSALAGAGAGLLRVATGGDDNALCVQWCAVHVQADRATLHFDDVLRHVITGAHASCVTALQSVDSNTLVTSSPDCRLNFWTVTDPAAHECTSTSNTYAGDAEGATTGSVALMDACLVDVDDVQDVVVVPRSTKRTAVPTESAAVPTHAMVVAVGCGAQVYRLPGWHE